MELGQIPAVKNYCAFITTKYKFIQTLIMLHLIFFFFVPFFQTALMADGTLQAVIVCVITATTEGFVILNQEHAYVLLDSWGQTV